MNSRCKNATPRERLAHSRANCNQATTPKWIFDVGVPSLTYNLKVVKDAVAVKDWAHMNPNESPEGGNLDFSLLAPSTRPKRIPPQRHKYPPPRGVAGAPDQAAAPQEAVQPLRPRDPSRG